MGAAFPERALGLDQGTPEIPVLPAPAEAKVFRYVLYGEVYRLLPDDSVTASSRLRAEWVSLAPVVPYLQVGHEAYAPAGAVLCSYPYVAPGILIGWRGARWSLAWHNEWRRLSPCPAMAPTRWDYRSMLVGGADGAQPLLGWPGREFQEAYFEAVHSGLYRQNTAQAYVRDGVALGEARGFALEALAELFASGGGDAAPRQSYADAKAGLRVAYRKDGFGAQLSFMGTHRFAAFSEAARRDERRLAWGRRILFAVGGEW